MQYSRPARLADALAALAAAGGAARPLAGGTDLLVRFGREAPWPAALVDLKALPELHVFIDTPAGIRVGAAVPLADLYAAPALGAWPALAEALRLFAARAIRERATLGGNLANASPAADTLPPLIAYGARCVTDRRTLAVEDLMLGPGRTALAPGELIVAVEIPRPAPGAASFFHKLAFRDAMAIAVVSVAASLEIAGGEVKRARIALGAVAPTVLRARAAEIALVGWPFTREAIAAAAAAAAAECAPIDDLRATAAYRRTMVERLLAYHLGRLLAAG